MTQVISSDVLGSYRPLHQVLRPGLLGHQRVAPLGHAPEFGIQAKLTGVDWPAIRDRTVAKTDTISAAGRRSRASQHGEKLGSACGYRAQMTRIGIIGVGRMGLPMCANLVRAGYEVTAGDARGERESAVTGCGARWKGTTAEVAAEVDVLITVLPGPSEVHDVMAGRGGVLAALPAAATWIDMTTSSPEVGRVLFQAADARGIGVLEAPAGGGVPEARAGKLQLFVGGDAGLVERHRPLLEVLADPQRITHVGGHGAGYLAKLLVNLLWFGQATATAEALLLARRAGLDLDVLRQALLDSAASSAFIRDSLGALLAGDYMTGFGLDRCCEELTTVTALGREHDVPFELSALVERIHRRALTRYGPADGELLAVALLEEQAGIRLRHGPPSHGPEV